MSYPMYVTTYPLLISLFMYKYIKGRSDNGIFGADLNKKPKKVVKSKPLIKYDSSTSWRPKLKSLKRPMTSKEESMDDITDAKQENCEQVERIE